MTVPTLSGRPVDVVVVGAGVVGLSTAVSLAEAGLSVRVDAAVPPERAHSTAAGAAWDPHLVEPSARIRTWAAVSLVELTSLSSTTRSTGVRLVEGTQESREPREMPFWADMVGARFCDPQELHDGYRCGWKFTVPVIDAPTYLGYLKRRLMNAGGRLRKHAYTSLAEAAREAPVVVNCAGVGARTLAPDPLVTPVKGQIVVVRNPGIDTFFCDDTPDTEQHTYFYPHGPIATLGGSQTPDNANMIPDAATARQIVNRCAAVEPRLRDAHVLEHRVGLRPFRPRVRLGEETLPQGERVLHNYGHGGAGFTLAAGCAAAVAAMVTTGATA
ncbi:FAD-dependent oxidoreductase [Streptodolium elevatio]